MSQKEKDERETRQVAGFLHDRMAYDRLENVKPDPPDIRVWHNGSPILNVEITEYHADHAEVGRNKKWNKYLWPQIEGRIRHTPTARNIHAMVVFKENLGTLNKVGDEELAVELVGLADHVGSTLDESEHVKIYFSPREIVERNPGFGLNPRLYPAEEWPHCSRHVSAITFHKLSVASPRWSCPQVDTGWEQMPAEKFRSILDGKDARVRKARADSERDRPAVPIWLVIVSDLFNDATNHLFPEDQSDRADLLEAVSECNYDFASSPFDEVWLYAEFGRRKLRLFPPRPL